MTGKFTTRTGQRVLLSTMTLPAPARWPYREHRSMAEVMADEQAVADAVHNYIASGTDSRGCAMEIAAPASASTLDPEPDQSLSGRPGYDA